MITIVMLTGEKYPINIESPGGISDMRIRAQQRFISLQTVTVACARVAPFHSSLSLSPSWSPSPSPCPPKVDPNGCCST